MQLRSYAVAHNSLVAPHQFASYCMLELYPSNYHSFEYPPSGTYKMVCD
jgi:hypothetical protein